MSFGGILAQALAGGAGAIRDQATGDIADQRKAEMMRQEADIREQAEKRLIEFRSNAERIANKNRLTDTRDFQSSDETIAASGKVAKAASDNAIRGKVAEATNPELLAADEARADAELARKIKAGKALLPLEIERASKLAAADAGTRARFREKNPTMADKAAELETFLGRKLLPEERERMSGLAKGRDPETGYETVEQREYDANGQEIRKTTRKEPIRAGDPGKPDPADPYAVPKREAKPGAAPKPAATDKPQGKGILQSLGDAVGGALESNAEIGRTIEAVRAKVRAGQPLTAQEAAIAKQYSLTRG
jgi:hypothetical protein